MKVLWMRADCVRPLDSGAKKRTFNLLKHSQSSLETTYLGYTDDQALIDSGGLSDIARSQSLLFRPERPHHGGGFYLSLLANLGSAWPFIVVNNVTKKLRKELSRLFRANEYDLLVCDSLDMAGNVDFSLPVPKVLMAYGIETVLWQQRYETSHGLMRRAYFNYEIKRLAAYESAAANKFDMVIAVSEADREKLESEYRVRVPIEVVETGVDCTFFAPQPEIERIPKRLVFTGSGDLLSNIDGLLWFAAEVLPALRKVHPDITLDIIGPDPAAEIVALGKKDDAIRVTGWVDDIRPYLAAGDIYIVPLRVPGGTRVKVYEAMAMKMPVVTTDHGIEGLPLVDGVHLSEVHTPAEFADSIIDMLDHPEKKAALAEAGWRAVCERYDWSVMADNMVKLFEQVVTTYRS
jgi:glycosyltransferase involved in cell wall biosynthesis